MIVVCVRTRDEAHRIARFCEAYKDADKILVADGGSEDNTIEIAQSFPNVEVRSFTEQTEMENGYWRNNDSAHANFLFEWAYSIKADWVIYDDCDCFPNYLLRQDYINILNSTSADVIMAVRLYLWGNIQHFPKMASPAGDWETSLYAWRGNLDLWTIDIPPAYNFRVGNKEIKEFRTDTKVQELFFPYCLLHCSWDDPDRVEKKLKIYRESGLIPKMLHPLEFAGELQDLPEFAHE